MGRILGSYPKVLSAKRCLKNGTLSINHEKGSIQMSKKTVFGIQWGSEIQPIEIQKYLRSRLFEGQISNSWTLATVLAIVPTIQKLDHCPDFKWLAFRISAC